MKYKVEKIGRRYGLYIQKEDVWVLHNTYATERAAELAATLIYDRMK